jgi:catechol 2,3-dioxygenase-like lactoylglutathione lyase family enzyme
MPTSIRFYRDLLGFTVAESDRPGDDCDWALLRFEGVMLMLNTAYEADDRPPASDAARIAAHRDTSFFFGCPDVDGTYERLALSG